MIRKLFVVLAFIGASSAAAVAQEAGAAKFSSKSTTIGAILDNEDAKAAFTKIFPDVAAMPQLEQARDMTIEDVKGVAPQFFPDAKVAELDVELAKIK